MPVLVFDDSEALFTDHRNEVHGARIPNVDLLYALESHLLVDDLDQAMLDATLSPEQKLIIARTCIDDFFRHSD